MKSNITDKEKEQFIRDLIKQDAQSYQKQNMTFRASLNDFLHVHELRKILDLRSDAAVLRVALRLLYAEVKGLNNVK